MTSAPREALFLPLGYSLHRSETWYHIRVRGQDRVFRPAQAWGLSFLMELNPDAEHWRRMFPTTLQGRKIDVQVACGAVRKLCLAAGEVPHVAAADAAAQADVTR